MTPHGSCLVSVNDLSFSILFIPFSTELVFMCFVFLQKIDKTRLSFSPISVEVSAFTQFQRLWLVTVPKWGVRALLPHCPPMLVRGD